MFLENIDTMVAMDLAAVTSANTTLTQEPENESHYTTSTQNQIKVLCRRVIVKTLKYPRPVVITFMRFVFSFIERL